MNYNVHIKNNLIYYCTVISQDLFRNKKAGQSIQLFMSAMACRKLLLLTNLTYNSTATQTTASKTATKVQRLLSKNSFNVKTMPFPIVT